MILGLATHLVAAAAGAVLMRLFMLRHVRVRQVGGRTAFELTSPHDRRGDTTMPYRKALRRHTIAVILIVAALVLIAIGIQAKLAADDNRRRDAADAAYADCMTRFAGNLVDSLENRTQATARLERVTARRDAVAARKSALLDRLLTLTLKARTSGAASEDQLDPRLVAAFNHVLAERVQAQVDYREADRAYRRVKRDVLKVRQDNAYVKPQVVCSR